jgi:hypothetical protein
MTDVDDATLERMAVVRAYRDMGKDLATAAGRAGITVEAWRRAEPSVLAQLDEDVVTGRSERLEVYDRAYRRVRGGNDPIAHALRTDRNAVPAPARPRDASLGDAGLSRPPLERASFQVSAASAQAVPAAPVGTETAAIDTRAIAAALPFAHGANAAAPPSAPAKVGDEPYLGTGTEAISMDAIRRAITPFLEKRAPPPDAAMQPIVTETAAISAADIQRALMPFTRGAPAAAPAAAPKPLEPHIDTGTAAIDRSEVERVLANMRAASKEPPSPPARGGMPPTVMLPGQPALPPPGLIPLEEYARISATLAREGDPSATFRRLGIDMVEWMRTVRAYSVLFSERPELDAEYRRLVDRQGRR